MSKFNVGDQVEVNGQEGTVTEVAKHNSAWFASGHEQLYSVRLSPWTKTDAGNGTFVYVNPANVNEVRDHEADTLGAIEESELSV